MQYFLLKFLFKMEKASKSLNLLKVFITLLSFNANNFVKLKRQIILANASTVAKMFDNIANFKVVEEVIS